MRMIALATAAVAVGFASHVHAQVAPLDWQAPAAVQTYRFEIVDRPLQAGGIGKMHQVDSWSIVKVRLVCLPDGRLMTNALLTTADADMSPDGMPSMTGRVKILPSNQGTYRLEVHPGMAGTWAIHVSAKIPGVPTEVHGTVITDLAR